MKKKSKKSKSGGGGGKAVDFDKYLRGLNRHLDKAKEAASEGGFDEYSDGRYVMKAVDAKIGVSKNKRVQVIITWKFMGGDYKGKQKLDFEGLTEDHLSYLLRKLDAMGYDTSELENLEDDLKQILNDIKKSKPVCKVSLKTKGEFQNVYVNGLAEDGDEEEEEEDEEDDEESDEEDDDEPKKKKGKKKSKKDDEDDDEDDEESDEDDSDDSEDDEESDDDDEDDSSDDDDDEEEEEDKPKKKKSSKKKKDDDDDEDEDEADEEEDDDEDAEDEVEIVVGSVVKADTKKEGKVKGTVVELHEAEGKVLLKTEKGKTLKISVDKILSVEETPEASVPKKKKKK